MGLRRRRDAFEEEERWVLRRGEMPLRRRKDGFEEEERCL